MSPEEREAILNAKERGAAELAAADLGGLRLDEADPRLRVYLTAVRDDTAAHCAWEVIAAARFIRLVRRYGIDTRAVRRFVTFYESLYFPGLKGMQRYRLTPVQAFQFASIYGFTGADGRRITREAVLFVPRKFSKTTSTAAVAVYDLLFGDANGEAYVGANSLDQAKKCFDVIRGCVRRLDPHGRRYVVNEQVIKSNRRDRGAFAQCLTANARTKDGLNASVVIMDEFSQARDNELLSVLTTSTGVRPNPLLVIITTASDVFDGPFYGRLQGYKRLLLGEYEDDSVFAHLFEPDPDDAEDDPATWRKVQPHLGVTIMADYYEREYTAAQRNGADAMLAFRTKLLNLYVENSQRAWISAEEIRAVSQSFSLSDFRGRPDAMCAVDLSVRDDFSAVTFGVYTPQGSRFWFYTRYFFPAGALAGHPNEDLYRRWASQGHLVLLPGDVIDYDVIADYVDGCNSYVRLLAIGYDAYKSKEFVNRMTAHGAANIMRAVSQTYGTFTAPCEAFVYLLKTGHLVMHDNPINAYCFGNAVLDTDSLENCKPIKRNARMKIDGAITALMCQRLFMDARR